VHKLSKHFQKCYWYWIDIRAGKPKYLSSIATSATWNDLRHGLKASRRLPRPNWHSTGISPGSYYFHFNHIQCASTSITYVPKYPLGRPSSSYLAKSSIFRSRPSIAKEEPSHLEPTNGLAGQDLSDLPARSRPPPTSMIGSMATRADLTIAQSDTTPSLLDSISSSDDPVHYAHSHQRYETVGYH